MNVIASPPRSVGKSSEGAIRGAPLGNRAMRTRETNLFDPMRVVAASMVLWGHAFSLTGHPAPGWFGNPVGTIGVKIFFVISGLLITRSWLADPRPYAYVMRRVLRIMPALILVVALTVMVLGPVFSDLSLHDYLRSHATRFYLWNIALYPVYALPGVFSGTPYPAAINGSLWSLPAEISMYIATPFIIGRSAEFGRLSIGIATAISIIVGLYFVRFVTIDPVPVFYGSSLSSLLDVAPYFQIGALFAVFRLDRFGRPMLSLALFVISAITLQAVSKSVNVFTVSEILLMMTLPFMVVSVGSVTVGGALGRFIARADVSYGLYLYGFPIQQAISALWHGQIGPLGNFAIAWPITFLFALLSWKTVEQTALRIKPRRPPPRENPNVAA